MRRQKFYAVRVVVRDLSDGTTNMRDYVRGEVRMGKEAWKSFALGDFINLLKLADGKSRFTTEVIELYPEQVTANRKYQHTSH